MKAPKGERLASWAGSLLWWAEVLIIPAFIAFHFFAVIVTPSPYLGPAIVPSPQPNAVDVTIKLKRGDFVVHRYVPGQAAYAAHPRAVIIFGSGDGGPVMVEDRICRALQADGCEMISFNCNAYAKTDYDLATLQADMNTIAQSSISQYPDPKPPLIIGGWSMGAEQAVPAGGGPDRPQGLIGLLILSPGGRGRYGLRDADRWDVPPTGPGTFALEDFSTKLDGLRVVQWNANLDLLGAVKWLDTVTTDHRLYHFNYGFHDYDGADDKFLIALKKSVGWILALPDSDEPGH
jgi:hypothetical protein